MMKDSKEGITLSNTHGQQRKYTCDDKKYCHFSSMNQTHFHRSGEQYEGDNSWYFK